jgi:hypothetical protein
VGVSGSLFAGCSLVGLCLWFRYPVSGVGVDCADAEANYILWVMFECIQKTRLTGPVVYSNHAARFWSLSLGLNKGSEN